MASLIETVRVVRGGAPLWLLHLRRLRASCAALGLPFPPGLDTPRGGPDRIHRLELGPEGVRVSERPVGSTAPVRLATASVVHLPYPHKTTDREQFEQATEEARGVGADEALLLTGKGEVAEATIWSVFWWEGDRLCVPALELGILPGVGRVRIAQLAGAIVERRLSRRALTGLPLFLANAGRGISPVFSLDGEAVPSHPSTDRLRALFWGEPALRDLDPPSVDR